PPWLLRRRPSPRRRAIARWLGHAGPTRHGREPTPSPRRHCAARGGRRGHHPLGRRCSPRGGPDRYAQSTSKLRQATDTTRWTVPAVRRLVPKERHRRGRAALPVVCAWRRSGWAVLLRRSLAAPGSELLVLINCELAFRLASCWGNGPV